ncbi:MAG: glycogen/starch synthase [Nitrospirales bacterium]
MSSNPQLSRMSQTLVFVTFESAFAPLGGLAAVMKILPRHMAKSHIGNCLVVAPFFREIAKCQKNIFAQLGSVGKESEVVFDGKSEILEVYQYVAEDGVQTFLIDSPHFFNAPCDCGDPPKHTSPCNPYLNPGQPEQLLQDALFFCKAVPEALVMLGYRSHLVFFLQDWETASLALTVKEQTKLESPICLLTLHNPYDKPLDQQALSKISKKKLCGPTVLAKMIPLLDRPLSTVSENFAKELLTDPLHTRVYAPHLQRVLKKQGLVGVNNGVFGVLNVSPEPIRLAKQGDVAPILQEKNVQRHELIQVLDGYRPAEAWGTLEFENFVGPIFFFFGRDDPRQKGYDVAAKAIEAIPRGLARYVFSPIPGDEGISGLKFLQRLTERRPGEAKVFPFRMRKGYQELQRGSSYLVMCSLYEPFGGATEGYVAGTPVVARATGGLVPQVCPYPSACLSPSVRRMAEVYHSSFDAPSGFLFREPDLPLTQIISGWKNIVECDYGPDSDRVTSRVGTPLFDAMVEQAAQALTDAITLYSTDQTGYARMIVNGIDLLDRFSWKSSVTGYQKILEASKKGNE